MAAPTTTTTQADPMSMAATSDNYSLVAAMDDHTLDSEDEEEEVQAPVQVQDKAELKKQRIAAAVERSKSEYKPEHAYTERGYSTAESSSRAGAKAKVDRQQLEFQVSALYSKGQYEDVVQAMLDTLGQGKKSHGLSRELLDTALKAAVKAQDRDNALQFARLSRDFWKGQFAGLCVSASDAFMLADSPKEATIPLIISTSTYGLHGPILHRLLAAAQSISISSTTPSEVLSDFITLLTAVLARPQFHFRRPLFDPSGGTGQPERSHPSDFAELDSKVVPVGHLELARILDLDPKASKDLAGALRRLENVRGSREVVEEVVVPGERVERGVREL